MDTHTHTPVNLEVVLLNTGCLQLQQERIHCPSVSQSDTEGQKIYRPRTCSRTTLQNDPTQKS